MEPNPCPGQNTEVKQEREIKPEPEPGSDNGSECILCRNGDNDDNASWVQCDGCNGWCHIACTDADLGEMQRVAKFHCKECERELGPSVLEERPRKRRRPLVNYAALNEGLVVVDNVHPHVQQFKRGGFKVATFPEKETVSGPLDSPVAVRAKNYGNLDMKVPAGLTPRKVAKIVGEDHPLPVVDVLSQNILPGWTVGRWASYFETKRQDRQQTLNVISLEFSDTPLRQLVQRPTYARTMDLVDKVWPVAALAERPKVEYYCLMGVAGSFTDFHIDFGGTSVFYHVISGAKTFAFVRPTKKNLRAYEQWCKRHDQHQVLFSELVDECVRVDVHAGDSLIIPAGWIHAVYTPEDAVVIGGNFLTLHNAEMQLEIEALERRTKVPSRFSYPRFRTCMWYAADWLSKQAGGGSETASPDSANHPQRLRAALAKYLSDKKGRPKDVSEGVLQWLAQSGDLIS